MGEREREREMVGRVRKESSTIRRGGEEREEEEAKETRGGVVD